MGTLGYYVVIQMMQDSEVEYIQDILCWFSIVTKQITTTVWRLRQHPGQLTAVGWFPARGLERQGRCGLG